MLTSNQPAPEAYDGVVVGGGPAGLEAALQLARSGASTALIEEGGELGGQYYKRRQGDVLARYGDYRPAGTDLIKAVRDAGVTCLTGRLVWGVHEDHRTLLTTDVSVDAGWLPVSGRAIVIATGAYERSLAFPGWQLPGVVTPGYSLHLATCDRVPVGARVVVAGTGPFLLSVACELSKVGCEVALIAELNHPYRPSLAAARSLAHPARLVELAGYLGYLRRKNVAVRQGWQVVKAEGHEKVERVIIRSGTDGRTECINADVVAIGYGFRPVTDLLQSLGTLCVEDPSTGDALPVRDRFGRTSVPGVYVAGESAGVAGVHAARVRGRLAGIAAAEDLELPAATARFRRRQLRSAAYFDQFAALNSRLFPITDSAVPPIPDETIICRCEGVTAIQVRQAGDLGWNDAASTKGLTRAGMGPCQGRECQPSLRALLGSCAGEKWTVRSPLKPVAIGTMEYHDDTGQVS